MEGRKKRRKGSEREECKEGEEEIGGIKRARRGKEGGGRTGESKL